MNTEAIAEKYKREISDCLPVAYKGSFNIYPVKYKDIFEFNTCASVLLFQPIEYPDIELGTLPRLYFLTEIFNQNNNAKWLAAHQDLLYFSALLDKLLKLVLHEQEFAYDSDGKHWFIKIKNTEPVNPDKSGNPKEFIIKARDFDIIREIILLQNDVAYDDTFVHSDIKAAIQRYESMNKEKNASTPEDIKEAFMLEFNIYDEKQLDDIYIRRFNRLIDKIIARETYVMQSTASMSGFVTFKDEIQHWITTRKRQSIYDKYFKEIEGDRVI